MDGSGLTTLHEAGVDLFIAEGGQAAIDPGFGFERHFIRGPAKMKLRGSPAMSAMLCMAIGQLKAGQQDKTGSLVQAA